MRKQYRKYITKVEESAGEKVCRQGTKLCERKVDRKKIENVKKREIIDSGAKIGN